jgi:hypothetical protein
LAFENAVALAVGFLEPDVVVFEIVELGFELVIDGKGDGVVGTEGESGDFLIDGTERIVEILGAGGRKKEKRINTEGTESAEDAEKRERSGHGFGWGPV